MINIVNNIYLSNEEKTIEDILLIIKNLIRTMKNDNITEFMREDTGEIITINDIYSAYNVLEMLTLYYE